MCTDEVMKEEALKILQKKSTVPTEYDVYYESDEVENTSTIEILSKQRDSKGGGGKFVFARESCKVVEILLYQ